jgi:DNA-binding IclR family transcriptional regulator
MLSHTSKTPRSSRVSEQVGGTQSIDRAIAVMREIAAHRNRGRTAAELAVALGLEKGTLQRILKGLVSLGMARRVQGTRNYELGPATYMIGLAAAPGFMLRELFQPLLQKLVEETGDAVYLVVRSGNEAVCLDHLRGTFPLQASRLDIGSRRPLGITAGALALLMHLPPEELAELIRNNTIRETTYGWLDADVLVEHVKESTRLGYALNEEMALPGISAIGLPVLAKTGRPFAAVSVASITSRIIGPRHDMLVEALTRTTSELQALAEQYELDWDTE